MLNIFPIQFLAPLAYLILRLAVGYIFIKLGVRHIARRNSSATPQVQKRLFLIAGTIEILVGVLYVLGLYTQIAALGAMLYAGAHILGVWSPRYRGYPPRLFFLLLFICSLSLFITGAGPLAFDLPI